MNHHEAAAIARAILRAGPSANDPRNERHHGEAGRLRDRVEAFAEAAALRYGEDDRQVRLAVAALEFADVALLRAAEAALLEDEAWRRACE